MCGECEFCGEHALECICQVMEYKKFLRKKEFNMDWIKKHVDTVVILGAVLTSVLWMNGKFNDIDHKFHEIDKKFYEIKRKISVIKHNIDKKFYEIEKEISIIKTVMLMKNILPTELAKSTNEDHKN